MHRDMTLELTTAFYGALAALLYVFLTIRVIKSRVRNKVSLLDGGIDDVSRHIRTHANFAEYVPFIILLMLLAELQGAHNAFLHIIGITTLIGRIAHYYSMTKIEPIAIAKGELNIKFRQIGMICTFIPLIGLAALLMWQYLV